MEDFGLNELEAALKVGTGIPSQLTGGALKDDLSELEGLLGSRDVSLPKPLDITPKEQAQNNLLERRVGYDVSGFSNKKEIQDSQDKKDLENSLSEFPTTEEFLSDPKNITIAKDAVGSLTAFESLAAAFKRGELTKEYGRAASKYRAERTVENKIKMDDLRLRLQNSNVDARGFIGWLSEAAEVTGQMFDTVASTRFWELTFGGALTGGTLGAVGGPVTAGGGSLIGAGAGSTAAVAIDAYETEGGNAFAEYVEEGIPENVAAPLSIGVGLINSGLEVASFGVLTKPFRLAGEAVYKKQIREALKSEPVQKLVGDAVKQYGTGIFTEVSTEVLQEVVEIVGGEIGKLWTDKDSITAEEFTSRITDIAVKTFKAMTVLGAPGPGINLAVQTKQQRDAKKNKDILDKMEQQLKSNELTAIDPDKSAEHAARVLENVGRSEVFIPGDKLKEWVAEQDDPNLIQKLKVKEDILEDAIAAGNDVTIAAPELTKYILQNEKYKDIADHIRVNEDGLTPFEAEEIKKADIDIEKEIENLEKIEAAAIKIKDKIFTGTTHAEAFELAQKEFNIDELPPGVLKTGFFTTTGKFIDRPTAKKTLGVSVIEDLDDQPFSQSQIANWLNIPVNSVAVAEGELGLRGLFRSAQEAGMSEKEYTEYLKLIENRRFEATKKMEDSVLAREQRKLSKEWQDEEQEVRNFVVEHLNSLQVYQAFHGIQRDRLNRAQVEKIAKEEGFKLEDLPTQSKKRVVYTTDKADIGVDIDAYAQLYGYAHGKEFLLDLVTSKSFNEAVDANTNSIMTERHGDIKNRKEAIIEARRILHDTQYESVLEHELNALRKLRKQHKLTPNVLKRIAKQRITSYQISDIRVDRFLTAERKNGRQAGIEIRKGNIEAAENYKLKQLINYYMATEAYKSRSIVEDRVKELNRINTFRKTGEKLPVLYQQAITEVLNRVSLTTKISSAKPHVLSEVRNTVDRPDIPSDLLKDYTPTSYKKMTLAEFTRIYETVKDIRAKGLAENKLRLKTENSERDVIVAVIADAVRSNLKKKPTREEMNSWVDARLYGRQAQVLLYNMDTMLLEIDGMKDLGPVYQNIKGRYDKALSEGYQPGQIGYLRRSKNAAKDLLNLYSVFTKKERKEFNKEITIPGVSRKLTRNKLISVLLNSGNSENINAMLESGQFTQEELTAIHNKAEKKDWLFVQSVWDYLETYWPDVKKAEEARRNYTPEKVEAQPIETKHGTFKGGYFPLRYDTQSALISRSENLDELHDKGRFGTFVSHHTARGHTQARKDSAGQPVLLDVFTLNSHVDQVIYDLEVGDAVSDIWKILSDKELKKAFSEMGQIHRYEYMELWVRDVTTEQLFSNHVLERSLRWIRTGYTVSKLAWNVGVGLVQLLGIIQSSVHMGHKNMFYAIYTILTSKQFGEHSIYKYVQNQTGFMASRSENFNKDVAEAKHFFNFGLLDKVTPGQSAEVIRESLFWMIKTSQTLTDTITWIAAKKQGMEKFGNDAEAKKYADRMVAQSQASGIFGERTPIERGSFDKHVKQTELIRAFSAFISYFMAKTNVAIAQTKKTNFKNPVQAMRWAFNMALLYYVETMLTMWITNRLPKDDDDESFLSFSVGETLNTVMSGVPFLREISSEIQGFRGGGIPSAISRDFGRLWKQVSQGELDKELALAANNVLGVLFHYPSAQINKTMKAYIAKSNNEDVEAVEFLLGPHFEKR